MGLRSIRMPDVGEGVAEAEVVEWHVKVGDLVREDQVVAAVMTDKATVEIPTPVAGSVVALGGSVGDVLAVGAELIRIDAPDLPDSPPPPPKGIAKTAAAAGAPDAPPQEAPAASTFRPAAAEPPALEKERPAPPQRPVSSPPPRGAPRPTGEKPLASPAVRLRAREAGVDLRFVHGTGPAGRVSHDDLDAFIAHPPDAPARGPGRQPNLAVETVKIVGMRRRLAPNMAESSRRVAHFRRAEGGGREVLQGPHPPPHLSLADRDRARPLDRILPCRAAPSGLLPQSPGQRVQRHSHRAQAQEAGAEAQVRRTPPTGQAR